MHFVLAVVVALQTPANPPPKQEPKQKEEQRALSETEKIEALIKHVAELKDAKFVRNGQEYEAKAAAEHLRKKWDYARKEIRTARDFIDKIATASSRSGKPYTIRFKDGKEVKSGEYLHERLKEIENPKIP